MVKTTFLTVFICTAFLGLNACSNTFEGAGQDIEKAGKWVQETF